MADNHRTRVTAVVVALILTPLAATAACSSPGAGGLATSESQITVFAASSLTSTFSELGKRFEAAHPGTTVRLNFAGSSDLVAQLQQGAPADVFASADNANMAKATTDRLIAGEPQDFATNSMEVAVPRGNPANVTSFAALDNPRLKVVICAPQVPCGAATKEVERKSGVTLAPVSEESAVADVLSKVASGEADAGVVYVTDVAGDPDAVQGVRIPAKDNAVNAYPIGVVANSANQSAARQFEDLVLGPEGRTLLADAGFGAP